MTRGEKVRVIIIIIFSFNDTVLSQNILAYFCMRRCREWGAMAAVGCRRPPWLVDAWFTCFHQDTLRVMCQPSKKSCQCIVRFISYVGFRRIWYKKPSRPAFYPKKPVQKTMISSIFIKKYTSTKNVMRNEIGENKENTIECYNKFVRPKLTELEICFPALMQLLVVNINLEEL